MSSFSSDLLWVEGGARTYKRANDNDDICLFLLADFYYMRVLVNYLRGKCAFSTLNMKFSIILIIKNLNTFLCTAYVYIFILNTVL